MPAVHPRSIRHPGAATVGGRKPGRSRRPGSTRSGGRWLSQPAAVDGGRPLIVSPGGPIVGASGASAGHPGVSPRIGAGRVGQQASRRAPRSVRASAGQTAQIRVALRAPDSAAGPPITRQATGSARRGQAARHGAGHRRSDPARGDSRHRRRDRSALRPER